MPSTAVPPRDMEEQIQAEERRNYVLEQIQDITTILKKLSLSVPETRLAIYSRQSDEKSIVKSSSIVHTEEPAEGIDTLCVAQRPADVDYTMEIQFKTPPQHSTLTQIKCQIVYDPGSDDCVLINRTEGYLNLANLQQSYSCGLITPDKPYTIQPGLWGIAVAVSDDIVDDCFVKFLLRERQHTISIAQPSSQRSNERSTKQQSLDGSPAIDITNHSSISIRDFKVNAKKATGAINNPLLDLQDGELANIQAPLPNTTFRQEFPIYQLKRISTISEKGFASVFSCRHSLVRGCLAVKVIQYEIEHSLSQLVYCAELFKREMGFLRKLKHVRFWLFLLVIFVSLFSNSMHTEEHCFPQGF